MPPRKTKKTTKPATNLSKSTSSLPSTLTKLCDGCAGTIPQDEALTCSRCHLSLHRYCAGIPRSHYGAISLNFICLACSQQMSDTTISELRDEIAALKEEVLLLKSALSEMDASAKRDSLQGTTITTPQPWSAVVSRRSNRRKTRNKPVTSGVERSSQPSAHDRGSGSSQRTKIKEEGKRKIWGTVKATSASAVKSKILSLFKTEATLDVKRKYRVRNDGGRSAARDRRTVWWFILTGEEAVLRQLESEWSTINVQTKWSLEPVLRFADMTSISQSAANNAAENETTESVQVVSAASPTVSPSPNDQSEADHPLGPSPPLNISTQGNQ